MATLEKPFKNYYKILGVLKKSSSEDIKKAYRNLVKITHPDLNPGPNSHAHFIEINEAYEILSDSQKRKVYDGKLEFHLKGATSSQANYGNPIKSQAEYDAWVREAKARASRHAEMKFHDFKKTKTYQSEPPPKAILTFTFSFSILIAIALMALPTLLLLTVDWKAIILNLILIPAGATIFSQGLEGIKSMRN